MKEKNLRLVCIHNYIIHYMDMNDNMNKKKMLETEIRQLKLNLYEKQFELSEIKNAIRKNCVHAWKMNDIEMGNTFFYESKCTRCDTVNDFDNLELT